MIFLKNNVDKSAVDVKKYAYFTNSYKVKEWVSILIYVATIAAIN